MTMRYLFLFMIALGSFTGFSQNRNILKVVSEGLNKEQKKLFFYKEEHPDSLSAIYELKDLLGKFHETSYILASVDTLYKSGDTLHAVLAIGPSWKWIKLRKGNLSNAILTKNGYREKFYSNTRFKYSELSKFQKQIVEYAENHGYPFAAIHLDSIEVVNNNSFVAALKYEPGPYIVFDSIAIIGKTKVRPRFLTRYLRTFPGQPFNQEKVNQINKLIREIPYLRQTRPLSIVFDRDKAIVNLFLEDRPSNQIDGIVGLLPNEASDKKLLITGELNLNLKNLFGTGKNLAAEWKKFNQASQLLNLSYYHPRLLGSNLDIRADFNLFKQDTSFLNINRKITISQSTSKYGRLNFQGGLKTSRELISGKISDKYTLPPFTSYNYYLYGIGYDWNNLDDIFYPHRGWTVSVQGLIGNKSILKSAGFSDTLYNNIQLKSVQLNLTALVEKYFKVGKKGVLLSRIEGGHILNDQRNLFYNDMFRIGGLKSLRGFNENNFYASSFGMSTLEYRFFTDEASYLLLFYDQAYIRNPLNTTIPSDFPYGFGAGISFTTNVGIFHFIYSLGNAESQKLNFNLSKIHFGMVSRF